MVLFPFGGWWADYDAAGPRAYHRRVPLREVPNENTGPARVYAAGEGFFEPPGSTHKVSQNASDTEPASLLAMFVADDGAQLTRGSAEKQM